jgi:hypothetical protein
MLKKLTPDQTESYKYFLQTYEAMYNTSVTFVERTEAFFCAIHKDNKLPWWLAHCKAVTDEYYQYNVHNLYPGD